MATRKTGTPKGILKPQMGAQKFQLARYFPTADLSSFIEHYWIVRWDLRSEEPYLQEILPYPSVHLAVQKGHSGLFGVVTGKFSRVLEDEGRVFGIKFRPGAFYPFVKSSVSAFTDKIVPLEKIFGAESLAWEASVLAEDDDQKMIELGEDFLRARLPEPDENVTAVNQVIDCIIADRTILRVDDVVEQIPISKRTLQRLFSQYVGVTPKWVIKRFRLHEAAAQLADYNGEDCAKLALELGYFDQAHFIKDFKTLIGTPPAAYLKQLA